MLYTETNKKTEDFEFELFYVDDTFLCQYDKTASFQWHIKEKCVVIKQSKHIRYSCWTVISNFADKLQPAAANSASSQEEVYKLILCTFSNTEILR